MRAARYYRCRLAGLPARFSRTQQQRIGENGQPSRRADVRYMKCRRCTVVLRVRNAALSHSTSVESQFYRLLI